MKLTLLLFIFFVLSTAAEKKIFTTNDHVKVQMQAPSKISPAKVSDIKIFFTPNDGIHINTEPMFELKLDKDSHFEISGEPRYGKNEKGYLDITKPIEFSIKTKNGIQPGTYPFKGNLFYFYCSDTEGWCNRFKQPVELTITVIR
ncbi:MAG: hypothetical protein HYV29_00455 [Ignavibacteriales bacterium]|nr:hypothetical protein [Ignavibacteriales bacterium]